MKNIKRIFLTFILIPSIILSLEESNPTIFPLNYDENKSYFTIPITLGTEKEGTLTQTFNVQIDTTTSETWVPSASLGNSSNFYNENLSSTSVATNKTIQIEDEDGIVEGATFFDVLSIQGKDKNIKINNFGFVSVKKYAKLYKDYPYGKLGLGYRLDYGENYGLIKMLKINNIIQKERFYLDWNKKEFRIGIEEDMKIGENNLTFCNLTETDDLDNVFRFGWVCELTHIFLYDNNKKSKEEGYDIDYGHSINSRVIFDTAYPFISIPKNNFYKLINESHFFPIFGSSCKEVELNSNKTKEIYFECENDEEKVEKFNMTFVLDGYGITIKGKDLFKKNEKGKLESLLHFVEKEGEKDNKNLWSFGSPFMKSHSFLFDYELKKVGILKGERINLVDQWDLWMKGMSPLQIKQKIKYLTIGAGIIGGVLIIGIIILIIRACSKRNSEIIEHGPLMKAENMPESYNA